MRHENRAVIRKIASNAHTVVRDIHAQKRVYIMLMLVVFVDIYFLVLHMVIRHILRVNDVSQATIQILPVLDFFISDNYYMNVSLGVSSDDPIFMLHELRKSGCYKKYSDIHPCSN